MKAGDVIPMHPGGVPNRGVDWIYRDESTGKNWLGIKHDYDHVLIVRPYEIPRHSQTIPGRMTLTTRT